MSIILKALKQILKNQAAIMLCIYNISMVMARELEPSDSDDMYKDARALMANYIPTDMKIKQL